VIRWFTDQEMDEKEFASLCGVPQPSMHDILHKTDKRGTTKMPMIHAAMGWPPPAEPAPPDPANMILSQEGTELARMHDKLPEEMRRKLVEDARIYAKLLGIKL
jgi:hypothetical protein